MTNIKDRMADIKSWPRCTKCRTRDLIVSSSFYKCLECDHTGSIQEIPSWGTSFANTRTLSSSGLPITYHAQVGPYPQFARAEFGGIINARHQECLREDLFLRYWFKGVRHFTENGNFPSSAIIWRNGFAAPEHVMAIPSSSPTFVDVLRNNSRAADCAMVMFLSDDEGGDFSDSPSVGNKYLVANIHHVGQPSVTASIAASRLTSGADQKTLFPRFQRTVPNDLIFQPVDWRIISPHYGQNQLRLAVGFHSEAGSTNATFSVKEDLDAGAFITNASVRAPGDAKPVNTKVYEPATKLADAIAAMRSKCAEIREKVEAQAGAPADWSYDVELDNTEHHYSAISKIQELPIWESFYSAKMEADKELEASPA